MKRIAVSHSNIHFSNIIQESDSFNILEDEFMYNGGGVGLGDFNQDGKTDVYFAGNRVPNALYLNQGDFRFQEVGAESGTAASDIWSSGVSVIDINEDGRLDLYVSATHEQEPEKRRNKLLINLGTNKEGIPQFEDQAESYGLDDTSHTTQSVFVDYDLDGDLDVYMLLDEMLLKRSSTIQEKKLDGSSPITDKLFRNDGGIFTDVSREAGILIEGFGLGIAVLDVNQDDYPDLYISNDFVTNDVLYVNQQDGTFKNQIRKYIKHQSYSSMGSDVADLNGDGQLDLMTLDMLPNTNQRVKQMMNQTRFIFYELLERREYELQYVRNCLQISNGSGYSELSHLAGVEATDWSWSALFADYDLDGKKDLFISNGFPRDVTDLDFGHYRVGVKGRFSSTEVVLSQIPEVKIRNFFYQNQGDLYFQDVSESWGLEVASFSNGAAYGDLDNDGDLDLVVNNINDSAFVYQNQASTVHPDRHFLHLQFDGPPGNPLGIGAKVWVNEDDFQEYQENYPIHGYLSSMEPGLHIGLDTLQQLTFIRVRWSDGQETHLHDVQADQSILIRYADAHKPKINTSIQVTPLLTAAEIPGLQFLHEEQNNFMDFRIQALLPHLHSREGPGMAVGDVNQDGLDDLYIGNGKDRKGQLLMQDSSGAFQAYPFGEDNKSDDLGSLLLDVDGDQDLDLYQVRGGTEYRAYDTAFQDRLYLNDGSGTFTYAKDALPSSTVSSSSVNAADLDRDGDLDLFVGGRIIPQAYPMPESSFILQNEGGTFVDKTAEICPECLEIGMVSAALWTDVDQDGWVDLILLGEWMPLTLFKNKQGQLQKITPQISGPEISRGTLNTSGWWNSISSGDMDKDGDLDYILGNQGLNNQYEASQSHPLLVYAKDFDDNGSVDHVIGAYREGKYYPIHLRNDFLSQLSKMKERFFTFAEYANAGFFDLFTEEELQESYQAEAAIFESVYLENLGNHSFVMHPLPTQTQYSPVYGSLVDDVNQDGSLDILLIGNRYGTETFSGRHDASIGTVLLGDGTGNFEPIPANQSGFVVDGDAKSLLRLHAVNHNSLYLAAQNNGELQTFVNVPNSKKPMVDIEMRALDAAVRIVYADGHKEIRECYYGSGYLSQNTRRMKILAQGVEEIWIQSYNGQERKIYPK
ncbi:MAG: VCBS repeat-containing protein [Bacteroidota bacterium]